MNRRRLRGSRRLVPLRRTIRLPTELACAFARACTKCARRSRFSRPITAVKSARRAFPCIVELLRKFFSSLRAAQNGALRINQELHGPDAHRHSKWSRRAGGDNSPQEHFAALRLNSVDRHAFGKNL